MSCKDYYYVRLEETDANFTLTKIEKLGRKFTNIMKESLVGGTIGDFFNFKFYTVIIHFFKNQKVKIKVCVVKTGTFSLSHPSLIGSLTLGKSHTISEPLFLYLEKVKIK